MRWTVQGWSSWEGGGLLGEARGSLRSEMGLAGWRVSGADGISCKGSRSKANSGFQEPTLPSPGTVVIELGKSSGAGLGLES